MAGPRSPCQGGVERKPQREIQKDEGRVKNQRITKLPNISCSDRKASAATEEEKNRFLAIFLEEERNDWEGNMNPKKKNTGVVNDEVEELLRAAEDAALLKMSVNSHTVKASSSDLHPELDQRFRAQGVVNDEVEELLRAAEDAALLKLSVDSHTVKPSSSDIHPDLDQRFRALKSGPKATAKPKASTKRMPPPQVDKVKEEEGEDDLLSRFAALKATLPQPSPSTFSSGAVNTSDTSLEHVSKLRGGSLAGEGNNDDEEEDEVEKVIRWAMDAARLDPSGPSDDDDDDTKDDEECGDSENSDEDDSSPRKNQKKKHN